MHFVDTHCHIDLYPDYEAVLEEVTAKKIRTVAVTNLPSVYRKCVEICRENEWVEVALGFHPELVAQRFREIDTMLSLIHEANIIGEVGLDFVTSSHTDRARQTEVFEKVLSTAAQHGNKVLTVHSRRAADQVVEMVGDNFPGKVILHWYSGSIKAMDKALAQGMYFSINLSMLKSESGRKIISRLPKERVLTETDGPFVSVQGRPARPADIRQTVVSLGELWGADMDSTCQIVYENFQKVFESR